MTEQFKMNVKQADLDKMASFLRNRIRQIVLEHMHNYDPGAVAHMMSDLRALGFIEPTDAAAPQTEPEKVPSRAEHDVAQRAESDKHDKRQRELIRAANE